MLSSLHQSCFHCFHPYYSWRDHVAQRTEFLFSLRLVFICIRNRQCKHEDMYTCTTASALSSAKPASLLPIPVFQGTCCRRNGHTRQHSSKTNGTATSHICLSSSESTRTNLSYISFPHANEGQGNITQVPPPCPNPTMDKYQILTHFSPLKKGERRVQAEHNLGLCLGLSTEFALLEGSLVQQGKNKGSKRI